MGKETKGTQGEVRGGGRGANGMASIMLKRKAPM
jgi:hypothetical protein